MAEKVNRIAIVNRDKCRPKKCKLECKKGCPINRTGKRCIEVENDSVVSLIHEGLCIGCGICVKKCPFKAITILNIPTNLKGEETHIYSANSFKLHRLPIPKLGQVLGLVGKNGIGKSTALKILANKIVPNLGNYENPPSWDDIIKNYKGTSLQNYMKKLKDGKLKSYMKPQFIENLRKVTNKRVIDILKEFNERKNLDKIVDLLDLSKILNREISNLSGGELQRVAIAAVCIRKADLYVFDEPTGYLDIKQRILMAKAIRSIINDNNYIVVVEHDLAILDFLSDFICILYGHPGAYGFVSYPFTVKEGINVFLDGYIPTENMRFRKESLNFRTAEHGDEKEIRIKPISKYNFMEKTYFSKSEEMIFKVSIKEGSFGAPEIFVLLGENGMGKTTFMKILAGYEKSDNQAKLPTLKISYKLQEIKRDLPGLVSDYLNNEIGTILNDPFFNAEVVRPLEISELLDLKIKNLSGGELQRVAIVACLGKKADLYLIDEPSAYLDSEQRIIVSKIIKRFISHTKKTAFIVEHDFIMITYLADKIVLFSGLPGINSVAESPQSLISGMNKFLEMQQITLRRDPKNARPRVNKINSLKDREQKESGYYFFAET